MQPIHAVIGRLAALALLLAVTGAGAAGLPQRFDPARDPAADLATALAQARAEGKRVLVDVGGEWCVWCHVMDRFFDGDATARGVRDHGFVWLKVNVSPQNRNQAFLSRWPRIDGYPHLFVLDADGTLLQSQDTSALESGHGYDPAKMLAFLRRWSPRRTPSATLI